MTLLGKSFSVVIFVLSVTFMVLALAVNASHRNWRDVVLGNTGLKAQIESTVRINDQLRDERDRSLAALDREQASRRTALAALQGALDLKSGELSNKEMLLSNEQAKNADLAELSNSRAKELADITIVNEKLRAQIVTERQERDTLFAQTLTLTDTMNKLRGVVQLQKERNDQLTAQVTRYKEVVDANNIDMAAPLDGAPPTRNGNVLVVNRPNSWSKSQSALTTGCVKATCSKSLVQIATSAN